MNDHGMSKVKTPKLKNKTLISCSDTEKRVKGVIVNKSDQQLVVDLPSGFQMTLTKHAKLRMYVYRVGMLEFVSDGWPQT